MPRLPPRSKSSTVHKSQIIDQDMEPSCQSRLVSTSGIPANLTAVLLSLEATVNKLSVRLDVIDKQMTSMATDIDRLKVVNGMDVDHLSECQSVQLMTRDDVS